jgi:membrane-associated phospholipid phosphatase
MNTSVPYLTDLVSVCIIALFAYPVLRFAETLEPAHLVMLAGMVAAEAATKLIKAATAPCRAAWLKRPRDAKGCDLLCTGCNVAGAPGFPSGHVTSAAFFFTYLICRSSRRNGKVPLLLLLGGCGGTLAVAASRVLKRCHTPLQVASGALWGAAAAVLVARLQ